MLDGGMFSISYREDQELLIENWPYSSCYRFYIVIKGELSYLDGSNCIRMCEGDIMVLTPEQKQVLAVKAQGSCKQLILYLPEESQRKLYLSKFEIQISLSPSTYQSYSCLHVNEIELKKIERIFHSLEQECIKSYDEEEQMKNLYLCEWIMNMNRLFKTEKNNSSIASDVKKYLDKNFSINISQNDLAKHFHISKFHMLREFKKQIGKTIHEYVTEKRLNYVKAQMEEGQSIMAASNLAGFSEYSLFYKAFLKQMGESPKQYQNRILQKAKCVGLEGEKLYG